MADRLNLPVRELRPRPSAQDLARSRERSLSSRGGITRRGRTRTSTPRGGRGRGRTPSRARDASRGRAEGERGRGEERRGRQGPEEDEVPVRSPDEAQIMSDRSDEDVKHYRMERSRPPTVKRTEVPPSEELKRHLENMELIKRLAEPDPRDPNAFDKNRDPHFCLDFATHPPTAYKAITLGPLGDPIEGASHRPRFYEIDGKWMRYTSMGGHQDVLLSLGPPPVIDRISIGGLLADWHIANGKSGDRVLPSLTHRKRGIYGLENEGRLDERRRF